MQTTVQVAFPTADLPVASVAGDVLVVVLVALVVLEEDPAVVTGDPPNANAVPILMSHSFDLARLEKRARETTVQIYANLKDDRRVNSKRNEKL